MSWATLRPQIYQLLNDNKATLGLQEVHATPQLDFAGYPAADVSPTGHENTYDTTSENKRIFEWVVRVFYDTNNTTIADAIPALETLVDNVVDLFDQENEQGGSRIVGVNMPARYTFINIQAMPGRWFKTTDEQLLYVELVVRIVVTVDVV